MKDKKQELIDFIISLAPGTICNQRTLFRGTGVSPTVINKYYYAFQFDHSLDGIAKFQKLENRTLLIRI